LLPMGRRRTVLLCNGAFIAMITPLSGRRRRQPKRRVPRCRRRKAYCPYPASICCLGKQMTLLVIITGWKKALYPVAPTTRLRKVKQMSRWCPGRCRRSCISLTTSARCAASASTELSTGIESVDQVSQPERFAPKPRDRALSFLSETTIPMPKSSLPVTIRPTFSIIVAFSVTVECVYDDPRLRNEYIVAIRPLRFLTPTLQASPCEPQSSREMGVNL
jgi:hypothetical protein